MTFALVEFDIDSGPVSYVLTGALGRGNRREAEERSMKTAGKEWTEKAERRD